MNSLNTLADCAVVWTRVSSSGSRNKVVFSHDGQVSVRACHPAMNPGTKTDCSAAKIRGLRPAVWGQGGNIKGGARGLSSPSLNPSPFLFAVRAGPNGAQGVVSRKTVKGRGG